MAINVMVVIEWILEDIETLENFNKIAFKSLNEGQVREAVDEINNNYLKNENGKLEIKNNKIVKTGEIYIDKNSNQNSGGVIIKDCINMGNVSGQKNVGGIAGGIEINNNSNIRKIDNFSNGIEIDNFFNELKEIIYKNLDSNRELLKLVDEMKETKNTNRFKDIYNKFVSVVADHITLFSPFIPVLTKFLV